ENGDVDPYTFKQALNKYPEIQAVSLGHLPMSDDHWGNYVSHTTNKGEVKVDMPLKYVDEDYLNVYDLKLLAGRGITLADTTNGIVLNGIAVNDLGFKTPQEAI